LQYQPIPVEIAALSPDEDASVVTDYLVNMECTTCGLSLMQSPRSAVNRIVFCTVCRCGGHYADIVEERKALTSDFITMNELEDMLSAIGQESE
jgi:hypothetical protein